VTSSAITSSKNPILPGRGVCDPHIHVFQDRAYLYASHDRAPDNRYWLMDDWQIWSSDDLVAWTLESTVRPEDTYVGPCENCWATDAAERDGKYYFYFSQKNLDTGVMVSDQPGRGFVDALGRPLLPRDLTPTRSYDPTVFIDDDAARTPYIVFGNHVGDGYFIARLSEDMISLAEQPVNIRIDDHHARTDKSFLHKHGGRYYLSWDSNYAISRDIRGPYRHAGNIGVSHDHGSFFAWRGQWFNAFTIFEPTVYHRATGLCYIHYRANGEMAADPLIAEHGVGHYDARWNKIEAEWYMAAEGVAKTENASGGFDVRVINDEASLFFPKVHDLQPNASVCFYAANPGPEPCRVEIRQHDANGTLLGALEIPSTFAHGVCGYDTFPCPLRNPAGTLDLHFVFHGRGRTLLALDWFKFSGGQSPR
jgi:arabinoxylan arabinofuranohydrolase